MHIVLSDLTRNISLTSVEVLDSHEVTKIVCTVLSILRSNGHFKVVGPDLESHQHGLSYQQKEDLIAVTPF